MRAYKRCGASVFAVSDSIGETYEQSAERLQRVRLRDPLRLSLFGDWRELHSNPVMQLHKLTDEAYRILRETKYELNAEAVKALLVERVQGDVVEAVGVSIKFPAVKEIRRTRGLFVYEFVDQPTPEPAPVEQADLLDRLMPEPVQPERHLPGLRMTRDYRVLSLTRFHARLCRSGRIEQSCSWGAYDRLTQGVDGPPPDEDIDALGDLAP